MGWKDFELKVYEYFRRCGYIVKLNEKLSGLSGTSYEVDVLAIDKNFEEVKIACQCKAWTNTVDRDSIILWAKVCEDIRAIPALASTSGYTDSALGAAKKMGFIILAYDAPTETVYKVGVRQGLLYVEEPEYFVTQAERKLKEAKDLEKRLNELYGKESENEEMKLEDTIRTFLNEVISLYKEALRLKPDKHLWLKLGDIYDSHKLYLDKTMVGTIQCYINALKEHLKEFPEILKRIGFIRITDEEEMNIFEDEIKKVFGYSFITNEDVMDFRINMLKLYLEKCPEDAEAWLQLARYYAVIIKEVEEADDACEKALRIASNDLSTIIEAYVVYRELIKITSRERRKYFLEKCINLLGKMCELVPEDPFPWKELAQIYANYLVIDDQEKNLDEAIRCMEEYMKRGGKSWTAWKSLGDMYFMRGDREKMLECYSKALEIFLKTIRRT